jgi:DNA-directed RNA polymerase subunit N
MIIPIRCWSCGKPIAHLYEEYVERVKAGEDMKKVLDSLGLERYCCRAAFMGNVELSEHLAKFRKF